MILPTGEEHWHPHEVQSELGVVHGEARIGGGAELVLSEDDSPPEERRSVPRGGNKVGGVSRAGVDGSPYLLLAWSDETYRSESPVRW